MRGVSEAVFDTAAIFASLCFGCTARANEHASERSGDPTCARRGDEAVVEETAARGGGNGDMGSVELLPQQSIVGPGLLITNRGE